MSWTRRSAAIEEIGENQDDEHARELGRLEAEAGQAQPGAVAARAGAEDEHRRHHAEIAMAYSALDWSWKTW